MLQRFRLAKLCIAALIIVRSTNAAEIEPRLLREPGGVRKNLEVLTDRELSQLRFNADLDVSVNAAWVWYKRRCAELTKQDANQADQAGLGCEEFKAEFLGFVSGRINGRIPVNYDPNANDPLPNR